MCDSHGAIGLFRDGFCYRAEQSSLEAAATARSDRDEVGVSAERDQGRGGRAFDEQSDDDGICPVMTFGDRHIEQRLRIGSISVAIDRVHHPEICSVDGCLVARPIHCCIGRTRTVDPDDDPSYWTRSRPSHDHDWTGASARRGPTQGTPQEM
jgi:hypothetical protein